MTKKKKKTLWNCINVLLQPVLYIYIYLYNRYCGYSELEKNIEHSLSMIQLYFEFYLKFRATSQMLHITATALWTTAFLYMLLPWSQVLRVLQLFSQYKALQLQSVLLLLYLVSRKKSSCSALPSLLTALWGSGSFNIAIFSFFLCCVLDCWAFTFFPTFQALQANYRWYPRILILESLFIWTEHY